MLTVNEKYDRIHKSYELYTKEIVRELKRKMEQAKITAYAKINLVLDVLRKRNDGYHEVAMVMQAIDLADTILLEEAPHNWLVTENKQIPPNMNNLAMRAVCLMQEHYAIPPLKVTLEKRIPVAAGLAGGSTDCAGVLLGINQMYGLGLSQERLEQLGAELGSDVPFCIGGSTALATGRGEQITPLPICPDLCFVLVKPKFGVSTPKVYENLKLERVAVHPDVDACVQALEAHHAGRVLDSMGNLLESSTFELQPNVKNIKEVMMQSGCKHVFMSGSGPTVFAAFEREREARQYHQMIKKIYPEAIFARTVDSKLLQERVELYGSNGKKTGTN